MDTTVALDNNTKITVAQWAFLCLCTAIASVSMYHLLTERVFPRSTESYYQEGEKHFEADKFEKAIKAYKRTLAKYPSNATVWNQLGRCYHGLEKYYDAIACYKQAIEIDSNHYWSYTNIGIVYTTQGHYENAVSWLQKAIKISPNDEWVKSSLEQATELMNGQAER